MAGVGDRRVVGVHGRGGQPRHGVDESVLGGHRDRVRVDDGELTGDDDERFDTPEARGIDVLLRGLSMIRGDGDVLALSAVLFDALYEYIHRSLLLGREPA